MLNQRPGLILGFFVVLLLACVAGVLSVTLYIQNVTAGSSGNCSTRGVTSITASYPTVTVREYLDALKNKDYNRACTYFDPKGTIDVGKKSQLVSAELLKSLDTKKGTLISYRIVNTLVTSENTIVIVVDVKRSDQNQPYKLHLSLRQEVGGWKIIHGDGL